MARLPRLSIAGCPQHIIQRGNNRQACFFAEQDYKGYLDKFKDSTTRHDFAIHAFVLMSNHVHLGIVNLSNLGDKNKFSMSYVKFWT